jgi:hypothetical protein
LYRSLRLAAPAAALVALAAPAAAHAQTAALAMPGSQCIRYVDATVSSFPLQGSGFAPNASVSILADGAVFTSVLADANGSFQQAIAPPPLAGLRKNVAITADDGQGHVAGPLQLPEVKLTVEWPSHVRGNKRVLFRAYGFLEAGKNVYLHIRRGGKTRGTFSLGKADAPCGLTKRRLHFVPLSHYSSGSYDYYFDQVKKFDRNTPIQLHYLVSITRGLRSASAASHWVDLTPVGI